MCGGKIDKKCFLPGRTGIAAKFEGDTEKKHDGEQPSHKWRSWAKYCDEEQNSGDAQDSLYDGSLC